MIFAEEKGNRLDRKKLCLFQFPKTIHLNLKKFRVKKGKYKFIWHIKVEWMAHFSFTKVENVLLHKTIVCYPAG